MTRHRFTTDTAKVAGAKGGRRAVENGTQHKLTTEERVKGGRSAWEYHMEHQPHVLLSLRPVIKRFNAAKAEKGQL